MSKKRKQTITEYPRRFEVGQKLYFINYRDRLVECEVRQQKVKDVDVRMRYTNGRSELLFVPYEKLMDEEQVKTFLCSPEGAKYKKEIEDQKALEEYTKQADEQEEVEEKEEGVEEVFLPRSSASRIRGRNRYLALTTLAALGTMSIPVERKK